MKKLMLLFSVFAVALTLAACKGEGEVNCEENPDACKLVVWSFTTELEDAGDIDHFKAEYTAEGKEFEGWTVEYVVVETKDYMDSILPVLEAGTSAPDVFTGELDMIQTFMLGGYLANLEALMEADADVDVATEKADYADYIWQSGQDSDGNLRALSWQVTPGAVFFKVDMAAEVWGTESGFPQDPTADGYNQAVSDWVGANKLNSIANLQASMSEVKAFDASYRLFADDQAVRHFAAGTNDPASWLDADGKLNAAKITEQIPYIEMVKDIYGETISDSLTANAGEWSGEWFGGMGDGFTDSESNEWKVMAYSLPTWGLPYIIEPSLPKELADGTPCVKDDEGNFAEDCQFIGNWGMTSGPNSYFWGGTYLGVREGSAKEDAAFAFVKSMLFDKERLAARQAADSDMYSMSSVMDPVIASYEGRPSLGGMNHLAVFSTEAAKIDLSNVTEYDRRLNTLLGEHINMYKQGEYATLAETLQGFYSAVDNSWPMIYKEGLPTG